MSFASKQLMSFPSNKPSTQAFLNSSKPFRKFPLRKKFQSVQHRLQDARIHRPVRPDLDNLVHKSNQEETDEELAEGFRKLDLSDDDGNEHQNLNNVDDNQNELSYSLKFLKRPKGDEDLNDEKLSKAKAADELFFRLSRGIRILPEGLPGQRGMVTPLCPNNNELMEQMDKYCVIPPPWTTEDLKNLPECVCFRNVLYSRCRNCGHVMKGRVYKKCERHPGIAYLLDYFFCYECHAETDQLREL